MHKNSIHINGAWYNAVQVMEEIMAEKERWKKTGWEFIMQLLDPSECLVKFTTSGTTGIPKEVGFFKSQIVYSAANSNAFFGIHSASRLLLCLPADFVAGRLMMARALIAGAELLWTKPELNPLKVNGNIDFAAFTPAQVASILANETTREYFKHIGKIIIGGGVISETLETQLTKLNMPIYATYGMTETLTHIAVRQIGNPVYTAVYPDAFFEVNENECLVIHLPFISPEKMITKDQVKLINHHSFIWLGRADHVINTGGIKLYAEDMEARIIKSNLLTEGTFYISSKADDVFGSAPVIVMLKQALHMDVAALLNRLNGLLNKHEAIKHVVFFDNFEFTPTGKLKRQKF
jgi:O-succinylbenzoic acid--CoA ligase